MREDRSETGERCMFRAGTGKVQYNGLGRRGHIRNRFISIRMKMYGHNLLAFMVEVQVQDFVKRDLSRNYAE